MYVVSLHTESTDSVIPSTYASSTVSRHFGAETKTEYIPDGLHLHSEVLTSILAQAPFSHLSKWLKAVSNKAHPIVWDRGSMV